MTEAAISSVVLDSEGLSAWLTQDRKAMAKIEIFRRLGADLVISAATIIDVTHAGVNMARLNRLLSRLKVEPLSENAARAASKLLKDANPHGRKYAIDAMVAEVALRQPTPVAVLTSDIDDLRTLCGRSVRLIAV
ncbi:PIN domain-containing protein [Streptomyces sp. NPDC020096]